MRKIITKIICCTAATVAALGMTLATACSGSYKAGKLDGDISSGEVTSYGGFAVKKGNYVYFINGRETNNADNTFGTPVKGAIMRISTSDLSARNYSSVQTVVPHIAYSGSYNSGLYIYGDKIYYATPSTEKNSDGEVQYSNIAFKSSNLDGTETMKDYYVQYSDSTIEYRYVLGSDDVVYLLYVAKSEDYYGNGSSYTNIHSVNTKTGVNTLLAYNVDSVMFDSDDVTNPRVYYTMNVTDYKTQTPTASTTYNQVWTVSAEATEPKDYSEYFKEIYGDDYKPDEDPLYVNCGKLVYDGIGKIENMTGSTTDFNGSGAENAERPAYKYTLSRYTHDTLFYTRTSTLISTATLFTVKDSEVDGANWQAVEGAQSRPFLLRDGSSEANHTYIFKDGELDSVLIANAKGFIKTKVVDGQITTKVNDSDCYYITKGEQPTVLFTQQHGDKNYVYYSVTGGNGYSVYRVCYDGTAEEYSANLYPIAGDVNEYTPVKVLDLDCSSDWYKPEMIDGQLLFPTQTENMTSYVYIMACDLRVRENGAATNTVMSNEQIKKLSDKYADIKKDIDAIDSETFENLPNALKYAFYTNDSEYIRKLCQAYVDIAGKDYNNYWSEESLKAYDKFMAATGDWEKYADKITVNGNEVTANKRDYYYTVLGKMNEEDAKAYADSLKSSYMQEYPEKTATWFESLSTGAKVGFIIGVVAGGLIIIGAGVVVALVIIKKRKEKLPEYTRKRIKVDTTDDKDIDVYADENSSENK
ncbi:MAG: hypothetical protein K2L12_07635 [Clostridia bacterium]|nr:hypothetical protein [Clostridia bacterium]